MEELYRYISREMSHGVMRATYKPYICYEPRDGMWELYISKYDVCTEDDELVFRCSDYDTIDSMSDAWRSRIIGK